MFPALLLIFLIPSLCIPFVYLTGKKSPKAAAIFVALLALISIALLATTLPTVLDSPTHQYFEEYSWIPTLINTEFTLFVDGMSVSIAMISLVLVEISTGSLLRIIMYAQRWFNWRFLNIKLDSLLLLELMLVPLTS